MISAEIKEFEGKLEELRDAALSAGIPITRGAAYDFLLAKAEELAATHTKQRDTSPFRVLEVGTAVGLTAISLAGISPVIHITSIELDEARHLAAKSNVVDFGLTERIDLHLGDASQFLSNHLQEQIYDFIYIDGPKAQYMHHFEMAWKLLKLGGFVIIDNVDFYKESKRYKTINKRMVDFRNFVLHIGGCILPDEGMAFVTKNQQSIEKEKEWKNRK